MNTSFELKCYLGFDVELPETCVGSFLVLCVRLKITRDVRTHMFVVRVQAQQPCINCWLVLTNTR